MTLITVISSLTLLVVLCSVRTVNSGFIVVLSDDEDNASPTSEPTFGTGDEDASPTPTSEPPVTSEEDVAAWFFNEQVDFIPISCCLKYTELTTEQKIITDAIFLEFVNESEDFRDCTKVAFCQCESSDMECFKDLLFSYFHLFSDIYSSDGGCLEALGGGFDDLCSSTFPNFEKPYLLQEWSALGDDITTFLELAGYEQSSWTPGEVSVVAPNACTAAIDIDELSDEQLSLATIFILEFARVGTITVNDVVSECDIRDCECSLSDDECLSNLFYDYVSDVIDDQCNEDAFPTSEPFGTSDEDSSIDPFNYQVLIPEACCLKYTELTTEQKITTDALLLVIVEATDFSSNCTQELLCQCESSDIECKKEYVFSSAHLFSDKCPEALRGGFGDLCSSMFPNFEKPYLLQEWSALGDNITTFLELAGYEQSSWTPGEVSVVAPNACTAAIDIDELSDEQQSLATIFILEFARIGTITLYDVVLECQFRDCECSLSDDECLSNLFYDYVSDRIDEQCNSTFPTSEPTYNDYNYGYSY